MNNEEILPNKPEPMELKFSTMTAYCPIGSPCKMRLHGYAVYGRYIANSCNGSTLDGKIYSILIICTPSGTAYKTGRCNVDFELTEEDLIKLKGWEEVAIKDGYWYHRNPTEIELKALNESLDLIDINNILKL